MTRNAPLRFTLRDGSPVEIRRVEPTDKDRLRAAFDQLGADSRYRRFMSPVARLSPSMLRYLTEVDQRDHLAWGAIDPTHPDRPGVGVARCVRLSDDPTVGEAAVTVVDAWHGRGLGTLLLTVLGQDAVEHGMTTFRGYVLPDNAPMRALIDHMGAAPTSTGDGLLRMDIPLPDETDHGPDTPAGRILRAVARSDIPQAHNPLTGFEDP